LARFPAWILIAFLAAASGPKEEDFTSIFDGKTLEGWHASNEPGHASGCSWSVQDGAIEGVQESPGEWGILTTAKKYGDFELRLEVKTEWPFDAGVIVRSSPEGHGYEVLIRSRDDGDVGGIAGSRVGKFHAAAKDWKKSWKKDGWNELRIAVRGEKPEIHTFLNGTSMADLRGEVKDPRVGATGHVALKIHAAEECFNQRVCFRNVRISEIK